jgi:hypothetical protein
MTPQGRATVRAQIYDDELHAWVTARQPHPLKGNSVSFEFEKNALLCAMSPTVSDDKMSSFSSVVTRWQYIPQNGYQEYEWQLHDEYTGQRVLLHITPDTLQDMRAHLKGTSFRKFPSDIDWNAYRI